MNNTTIPVKDLTPYVDSFLPERRGTRFNPVEGRNFTKETLTYMCPANIADRVTTGMVAQLPSPAKILILDVCSGIGGNSCSFLANDAIGLVISYEKVNDRRLMLKRNINAYGFGTKSIVASEAFEGTDLSQAAGCGIFFDPPWLPEHIPGHISQKSDYILHGIEVGGKTLEEWLYHYTKSVYIITFRVPPDYKLDQVKGWKYVVDDILTRNGNRGRIYHCLNTDPDVIEKYTTNLGGLKQYLPILQNPSREGAPYLLASNFIDPDPISDETTHPKSPPRVNLPNSPQRLRIPDSASQIKSQGSLHVTNEPPSRLHGSNLRSVSEHKTTSENKGTPVPIPRQLIDSLPIPSSDLKRGSPEWQIQFQGYIYQLLQIVTSKEDIRIKMVETRAMKVWIRAWTHETWNSNINDNYENIETIGDAVLGYAFKLYVYQNVPNITTAGISEYKAQYMSKMYQGPIAQQLKMGQWVLSQAEINVNILEDLFESFSGALHEVGDQVKPGLGAILVRNLITYIFKDFVFDPDMIRGTAKTVITQYAHRLHWGEINAQTYGAGNRMTCTVSLSPMGLKHLADNNMMAPSPLGTGAGASEKAATDAAYRDALRNLNKIGATYDWVIEQRSKISFNNLPQKLVDRVRLRANRSGYTTIKTITPRSTATTNSVVVQLIGIRDGVEHTLATVTANNEEAGKLQLFTKYADVMDSTPTIHRS
jgi:dsRNA-specific ribonuclease